MALGEDVRMCEKVVALFLNHREKAKQSFADNCFPKTEFGKEKKIKK